MCVVDINSNLWYKNDISGRWKVTLSKFCSVFCHSRPPCTDWTICHFHPSGMDNSHTLMLWMYWQKLALCAGRNKRQQIEFTVFWVLFSLCSLLKVGYPCNGDSGATSTIIRKYSFKIYFFTEYWKNSHISQYSALQMLCDKHTLFCPWLNVKITFEYIFILHTIPLSVWFSTHNVRER